MSSLKLQEQLDALAFPLPSHLDHDPIMTLFMSLFTAFNPLATQITQHKRLQYHTSLVRHSAA